MRLFDAGLREGQPQTVHHKLWTAANVITFLRLLGLPLFAWLVLGPAAYGLAFATLAVVATTDWIDGYVARRFDQVTKIGKLLDPFIDRLLLATAGIVLAVEGILPLVILVLIVARDVLLLGIAAVAFRGVPPIPVSKTGKFATANLLAGVPSFLLAAMDWPGADLWWYLAWCLCVVGIVAYYVAGVRYAHAARVALAILERRPERSKDGS